MKILITGANGYIGSHVVDYITQNKIADVVAVDFNNQQISDRAQYINFDILGNAQDVDLYQKLGKPDAVLHLAWRDGFNHASNAHLMYLCNHYLFLKNMIDSGCKNINIMGTMHEVGYHNGEINENTPCNPMSLYGIAKNSLRQAIFNYTSSMDVSVKWLRGFYITGDDAKNRSVFSKILEMERAGKTTFPFVSGENKYDFIDINKLSEYIAKICTQTSTCGIINVCSGEPVSLRDKVMEFIKQHKLKIQPEFGAYPSRPYDSPLIYGNIDKLKQVLSDNNKCK